jgi:hypothetical protein
MSGENEQKIKLSEEELKEFYEGSGSRHFKLQGEIFKEYGNKKLEIYFKLVEFTYQIVTVIGVISGLGFTALSSVQNRISFVVGEGFLFSGIIFGIYLVHSIYSGELFSLEGAQNIHRKHFKERNDVFIEVWDKLNLNGVEKDDLEKLNKIDIETVKLFEPKNDEIDWIGNLKSKQRILLYLLFGGCLAILVSIIL